MIQTGIIITFSNNAFKRFFNEVINTKNQMCITIKPLYYQEQYLRDLNIEEYKNYF